ncbi:MAG TPA: DNA-processing protein DprA, partial [bacterium]|nr:DNA-processing protein DprA [bacterium]
MYSAEERFWISLSLIRGIGPVRLLLIWEHFKNSGNILSAAPSDLAPILGTDISCSLKKLLEGSEAEAVLKKLGRKDEGIIFYFQPDYPELLKALSDPPFLIYYKGDKKILENPKKIALVGTRRPSPYGLNVCRFLAKKMSAQGFAVVSGLAAGIDAAAHQAVLEEGGETIAVLGNGTDIIYPPQNRKLYEKIGEKGLIISEFPPGTKPEKFTFPQRNRIISGLVPGVVVVEAPLKSGALNTAQHALEQGREVFTVPGEIFNTNFRGNHQILKEGAGLVEDIDDILDEINIPSVSRPGEKSRKKPAAEEEKILSFLDYKPRGIEEISFMSGEPLEKTVRILLDLE